MELYAVLGYPVSHTMSPPIHRRLFELEGSPAAYSTLEVPPEALSSIWPFLNGLKGVNVMIPHKLAVIPFLDRLAPSAGRYHSVNCIVREADGSCTGHNTDVEGFCQAVEAIGGSFAGTVCIIGAGGTARMCAIEAALRGAEVLLAARSLGAKTDAICEDIRRLRPGAGITVIHSADLEEATRGRKLDLLANATPVGMYPHSGVSPVPVPVLERCRCVFDAIYNPTETVLLKQARQAGCRTAGGMSMLVWQAAAAHAVWKGAGSASGLYSAHDMEQLILDMAAQVDRTFGKD